MISSEQAFCYIVKEFFKKAKKEYAEDKSYNALTSNQKLWVLKKNDIVKKYGISLSFAKNFMKPTYRITWDDTQKCIAWILDHFDNEQDRQDVRATLIEILMKDVGKYSVVD